MGRASTVVCGIGVVAERRDIAAKTVRLRRLGPLMLTHGVVLLVAAVFYAYVAVVAVYIMHDERVAEHDFFGAVWANASLAALHAIPGALQISAGIRLTLDRPTRLLKPALFAGLATIAGIWCGVTSVLLVVYGLFALRFERGGSEPGA